MSELFRIPHDQIKNAIRDVVAEQLDAGTLRAAIEDAAEKQKARLTSHTDRCMESITVDQARVNKCLQLWLDRSGKSELNRLVKNEVRDILEEKVSVAVRSLIKEGITVKIGTGWSNEVTVETEEVHDQR